MIEALIGVFVLYSRCPSDGIQINLFSDSLVSFKIH